ncbi:MAG: hypothetical protein LUC16_02175, partial [Coprobacillus sp.]|nr:hypothetical protein [Coprobacillus sp.]
TDHNSAQQSTTDHNSAQQSTTDHNSAQQPHNPNPNPNPNPYPYASNEANIEKSTTSSSNQNFDADSVRREKRELVSKIVGYYNAQIDEKGARLRKCERINKEREGHILARLEEYGKNGKQNVAIVIKKAVESRGLNYDMKIAPVDIGWIMRPRNFTDILEGKYDDNEPTPSESQPQPQPKQDDIFKWLPTDATSLYKDFYIHLYSSNNLFFKSIKDKLPTQDEFQSLVDEYGYEIVEYVSCVFVAIPDGCTDLYSALVKFCPEEKQLRERRHGKQLH